MQKLLEIVCKVRKISKSLENVLQIVSKSFPIRCKSFQLTIMVDSTLLLFPLGGVRGAGFIYSPLIKESSRVSSDLLHVTDWFPTILALAGADPKVGGHIDGKNIWDTLSNAAKSPRDEVLLNIDDLVYKNSALRKGKWKILFQDRECYFVLFVLYNSLHSVYRL